jgi:hypothetical protein
VKDVEIVSVATIFLFPLPTVAFFIRFHAELILLPQTPTGISPADRKASEAHADRIQNRGHVTERILVLRYASVGGQLT